MNKKYVIVGSVVILILAVISIVGIVYVNFEIQNTIMNQTVQNNKVMDIEAVAEYLGTTQGKIIDLIETDKLDMSKGGVMSEAEFPYLIVDGEYYFSKDSIDEWAYKSSKLHRTYDTKSKTVF